VAHRIAREPQEWPKECFMITILEDHHLALMCRYLQQMLPVTFEQYGGKAGTQIEIVRQLETCDN
jgi:hypothetical protein